MEGPILTAECCSMGSLKGPGGIGTGGETKATSHIENQWQSPRDWYAQQGWQAVRCQLKFPPLLLTADITS